MQMASCWVVYSVKEVVVTVFLFYSYWCYVGCHILVEKLPLDGCELVLAIHRSRATTG